MSALPDINAQATLAFGPNGPSGLCIYIRQSTHARCITTKYEPIPSCEILAVMRK